MNSALKLLNFENPVFRGYLTHSAILVLKMMLMALLTGNQRFKYKVFPSPEDLKFLNGKTVNKHEEVERVRRAHRNDMENIPLFFMVALTYLLTDPNPSLALNLFRIATISRCLHTYVYAIHVIPQPARGIAWWGAYGVTGFMAIKSVLHFCTF